MSEISQAQALMAIHLLRELRGYEGRHALPKHWMNQVDKLLGPWDPVEALSVASLPQEVTDRSHKTFIPQDLYMLILKDRRGYTSEENKKYLRDRLGLHEGIELYVNPTFEPITLEDGEPKAPTSYTKLVNFLVKYLYCLSYNDSYFGEPVGMLKQLTKAAHRDSPTPGEPPKVPEAKANIVKWLTQLLEKPDSRDIQYYTNGRFDADIKDAIEVLQVRQVTPLSCPQCSALWLFWPKEQTGVPDSLNLKSAKACEFCENARVNDLDKLGYSPL